MKTLSLPKHLPTLATAILTIGYLTVAGSSYAGDRGASKEMPIKGYVAGRAVERSPDEPTISPSVLTGKVSHMGKTTLNAETYLVPNPFIIDNAFPGFELNLGTEEFPFIVQAIVDEEGGLLALARIGQSLIYTAANGDELWMEQVATGFLHLTNENIPSFTSEAIICGGTGRFEGATGLVTGGGTSVWIEGPDNDLLDGWFEGTISTVGSEKGK